MTETDYATRYAILALDSGDTAVRWGIRGLADFAHGHGCYVDGALLRDRDTDTAMYATTALEGAI